MDELCVYILEIMANFTLEMNTYSLEAITLQYVLNAFLQSIQKPLL